MATGQVATLTELDRRIALATKTKSLDLSDLELAYIPTMKVHGLTSLKSLNLGKNEFNCAPPELFKFAALENLNLTRNKIKRLPSNLNVLDNLKFVNLSYNKLEAFPDALCQLPLLEVIDVSNNTIKTLPPAVGSLKTLREFKLGKNELTSIIPELTGLRQLKKLDVSGNQLTTLPTLMVNMSSLILLNVIENPLISPPLAIVRRGLPAILRYLCDDATSAANTTCEGDGTESATVGKSTCFLVHTRNAENNVRRCGGDIIHVEFIDPSSDNPTNSTATSPELTTQQTERQIPLRRGLEHIATDFRGSARLPKPVMNDSKSTSPAPTSSAVESAKTFEKTETPTKFRRSVELPSGFKFDKPEKTEKTEKVEKPSEKSEKSSEKTEKPMEKTEKTAEKIDESINKGSGKKDKKKVKSELTVMLSEDKKTKKSRFPALVDSRKSRRDSEESRAKMMKKSASLKILLKPSKITKEKEPTPNEPHETRAIEVFPSENVGYRITEEDKRRDFRRRRSKSVSSATGLRSQVVISATGSPKFSVATKFSSGTLESLNLSPTTNSSYWNSTFSGMRTTASSSVFTPPTAFDEQSLHARTLAERRIHTDNLPLPINMEGKRKSTSLPSWVQIVDNCNGTYSVNYTPPKEGNFKLHVTVFGEDVVGSPFNLTVGADSQTVIQRLNGEILQLKKENEALKKSKGRRKREKEEGKDPRIRDPNRDANREANRDGKEGDVDLKRSRGDRARRNSRTFDGTEERQIVSERIQVVAQLEQELRQKIMEVKQRDQDLQQKEQELQLKEQEIEKVIVRIKSEVVEQDKQLSHLQLKLSQREQHIEQQERLVDQKMEEKVKLVEDRVKERKKELEDKEKEIESKSRDLVVLQQQVEQQIESRIKDVEEKVKLRIKDIHNREKQVEEVQQAHQAERSRQLDEKEREIQEKEREVEQKSRESQDVPTQIPSAEEQHEKAIQYEQQLRQLMQLQELQQEAIVRVRREVEEKELLLNSERKCWEQKEQDKDNLVQVQRRDLETKISSLELSYTKLQEELGEKKLILIQTEDRLRLSESRANQVLAEAEARVTNSDSRMMALMSRITELEAESFSKQSEFSRLQEQFSTLQLKQREQLQEIDVHRQNLEFQTRDAGRLQSENSVLKGELELVVSQMRELEDNRVKWASEKMGSTNETEVEQQRPKEKKNLLATFEKLKSKLTSSAERRSVDQAQQLSPRQQSPRKIQLSPRQQQNSPRRVVQLLQEQQPQPQPQEPKEGVKTEAEVLPEMPPDRLLGIRKSGNKSPVKITTASSAGKSAKSVTNGSTPSSRLKFADPASPSTLRTSAVVTTSTTTTVTAAVTVVAPTTTQETTAIEPEPVSKVTEEITAAPVSENSPERLKLLGIRRKLNMNLKLELPSPNATPLATPAITPNITPTTTPRLDTIDESCVENSTSTYTTVTTTLLPLKSSRPQKSNNSTGNSTNSKFVTPDVTPVGSPNKLITPRQRSTTPLTTPMTTPITTPVTTPGAGPGKSKSIRMTEENTNFELRTPGAVKKYVAQVANELKEKSNCTANVPAFNTASITHNNSEVTKKLVSETVNKLNAMIRSAAAPAPPLLVRRTSQRELEVKNTTTNLADSQSGGAENDPNSEVANKRSFYERKIVSAQARVPKALTKTSTGSKANKENENKENNRKPLQELQQVTESS